jgi:Holliday junction resolvase RusA-like endonuclease
MIHLSVPWLPPSSNNAYFNLPRGGRALSKEGLGFKTKTTSHLVQHFRKELATLRVNEPYLVAVFLTFDELQNTTWPKTAKSRYKRLDASNRVKLLEDALKDATGVDDSSTFTLLVTKKVGAPERTDIFMWNLERENSPFDVILNTLV